MRLTFVEGNNAEKNIELNYKGKFQIPIFEFQYLKSESNNLDSGTTE
jgi:hypothetical protein